MSGTDPEEPTQPSPPPPTWETYQQPSTPSYPQAPYGQQPYGQPYGGAASPYRQVLTRHPGATSAMVMGIVALVGTFVCGILCVLGPFAWAKGAKVRKEIDAEPQRWSGRSEATVGYVMGIVTTLLMGLALLVAAVVLVIVAASASTT